MVTIQRIISLSPHSDRVLSTCAPRCTLLTEKSQLQDTFLLSCAPHASEATETRSFHPCGVWDGLCFLALQKTSSSSSWAGAGGIWYARTKRKKRNLPKCWNFTGSFSLFVFPSKTQAVEHF